MNLNHFIKLNFDCDRCKKRFHQTTAYSPDSNLEQLKTTYCFNCATIIEQESAVCSFWIKDKTENYILCDKSLFNKRKQLCRSHNRQVWKKFNQFLEPKSVSSTAAWLTTWEDSSDWKYFWDLGEEISKQTTNFSADSGWKKLKKNKLEAPPPLAETTSNLQLPEVIGEKIDKRTLRKTGRTEQFATRVSKEWLEQIKSLAQKKRLKLVELLEKMLESYKEKMGRS